MLTPECLPELREAMRAAGINGWLLFDFHDCNPVGRDLMGLKAKSTRRAFAWFPVDGKPVAITHAIEQPSWRHWPSEWGNLRYSSWRSLEEHVAQLVRGCRAAMEYSPGNAVPYVDRVPAGVVEMVRSCGAEVVSSGELITQFYAVWGPQQIASHSRAAELLAGIARQAFELAGQRARGKAPLREHELMRWIQARFDTAGLVTSDGPNVSAGANGADPHYEPSAAHPRNIDVGDLLLIDLWAREPEGPYADQTWVGSLGEPTAEALDMWSAALDARDAALDLVRARTAAGELLLGAEVDDAARAVVAARGYGEYSICRTGHSIDRLELHGSGPHIDNIESREERRLLPGVAFSIEPGIYIPGRMGMRSEVNVYLLPGRATVTPAEIQRELIVV